MSERKFQFQPKHQPGKDAVFCEVMLDGWLYERTFYAVTGKHYEIVGKPLSQTVVKQPGRELTPAESHLLNSVRLDTIASTVDAYLAADMQNEYIRALVINRAIFYGFRVSAYQPIPKPMRYDLLKPTIISFIVNDESQSESETIPIILANGNDGTKISDLLSVHIIFTAGIVGKGDRSNPDLYTLARFFEIQTQEQAERFEEEFGETELGGRLIMAYNQATANPWVLEDLGNIPYFTEKLTEEQLYAFKEEWKQEGIAEGIAEGRAEGIAEGMAKGMAKGKAEGFDVYEKELIKLGVVSPDILSKVRANLNQA
ncbi:MAG: hypothetical protein LBR77_06820 [Lachnospiraceae bacterium]|nr:hypothetical protein [Lachnospiraceae bacterium]